jgi:hypothetical protein
VSYRPVRYEPGDALQACSLCGFTCLASEMWYGDDSQFYCNRHVEYDTHRTVLTDSKQRARWRPAKEQVPEIVGPIPTWRQ